MLNLDVMLGERESRILGFACGSELLFMHDGLAVPGIPQRQAPVAAVLLYGKFDVIILRFVAVPRSHEFQYRASFSVLLEILHQHEIAFLAVRLRVQHGTLVG